MINLFPNEHIDLSGSHPADPSRASDHEINTKYAKGEIRIVTEQARYPLTSIPTMLESGDYKIDPEFQRRHRWDEVKKSRLIESFIMNVPVPPIFLYEDEFSHYEVMDGLQRLSAIREFYANKFALSGLQEWPELNGRHHSNLPDQIRRGIDRRYLSSIILLQETAKTGTEAQRLKQLVFERINSGGIKLEPQESRNAIYPGPLNSLCIKLSRNDHFCHLWGIPGPDRNELTDGEPSRDLLQNELFRRMTDVELVLRFFAYRQRLTNQRGALRDYFDSYLASGNNYPPPVLKSLAGLFTETIRVVAEVFGPTAFWLYRNRGGNWDWYKRPTTVVYDPMMFVVSAHIAEAAKIVERGELIRASLPLFYQRNYDLFEGRYTNLANIQDRNRKLDDFITEMLND